jgi:hypothetical protein
MNATRLTTATTAARRVYVWLTRRTSSSSHSSMPTTRSASKSVAAAEQSVAAAALVRFNSTLTEFTVPATAPSAKGARVTKRKLTQNEDTEETVASPPKRTRGGASKAKGSTAKAKPKEPTAKADSGRGGSEGILKPASKEVGTGPDGAPYVPASPASSDATTPPDAANDLIPAALSFDFDSARKHLIKVDARFGDLFMRMRCRPFEHIEAVDPFRTLVTSIL